ncbi:uncharacterized protein FIBRA_07684 [Fibroporia radiculosa]|uniref:Lysophospholipase n=1 Tax=Fibroporia radiculosa TaxID=599839 RepID=J4GFA2_9APHY|nr:uncharacterized protein FIBRA_07684 [Fibroporia radiculosa]CCM05463.1 predicted protein [Fibroporia radiculosa]
MLATLLAVLTASSLVSAQSAANQAYTPVSGACPSGFEVVRLVGPVGNQTLNQQEVEYISTRKANVLPDAWKTYLANIQATNASLPDYVASILSGESRYPNVGIASSGGGWRATLWGAGILNFLDARNETSAALGTGGILQAAQYLSGLSGGANLVGSFAQANFPTIQTLAFGTNSTDPTSAWGGWLPQINQQDPYTNATQNAEYLQELIDEIRGKYAAGFSVSYNDITARDNGRHFVNGTNAENFFNDTLLHGAGYTWSSVPNVPTFASYSQPFPILIATLLSPNGNFSNIIPNSSDIVPTSNPIMEMNVFEMGSYDPTLAAFTPMKYLGTTNDSVCWTNYDQTAFVVGASGDWNTFYNTSESVLVNSYVYPIVTALNESIPQTDIVLDSSLFPNPFRASIMNGTFIDENETLIMMSDGASDGEAIPIQPLMVKARGLDTIFALDANQDFANAYWSAGGSLVNTQNRINTLFPTAYSMPPIPTNTSEFSAQNLSIRPTFFGCDTSTEAPLIIYIANGGPPRNGEAPLTNQQPSNLTLDQTQAFLDQVYAIAMQGYPTNASEVNDPEWPACLACAVVDRARNATGTERSGLCSSCFERYCWNGTEVALTTTTTTKSGAQSMGRSVMGVVASTLVAAALAYF